MESIQLRMFCESTPEALQAKAEQFATEYKILSAIGMTQAAARIYFCVEYAEK